MHPVLFTIGSWEIYSSHVFLILAILVGVLVSWREARGIGFSNREVVSFWAAVLPFALILGLLNGLLFWFKFVHVGDTLFRPFSFGLVSFGVILGALFLGWVFAALRKLRVGPLLDLISVTLPLMLSIYRIGCLLNGCCYGVETDGFLGMFLPGQSGEWAYRFPTQIMLIFFNLALFIWLWLNRKNKPFEGSLTLAFLIVYSLGRLLIDAFRDLPHVLGPLSPHQLASIAILLITLYICFEFWLARRARTH